MHFPRLLRFSAAAVLPWQRIPFKWSEWAVPRRVKIIDISEYTSLEDLIRYLETMRDNLPRA